MASATKKSNAAKELARRPADGRVPELLEFLVFEDNGGKYHWTICDTDGAILARSGSFASHDDAEKAAQRVRAGAGSAQLARGAKGALSLDAIARRAAASDDADAERWLDEGGSFSSKAVADWQAPR